MNFNAMPYQRIDIAKYQHEQNNLIDQIASNQDHSLLIKLIDDYRANYIKAMTNASLAEVRHTINTNDKFYDLEVTNLYDIYPLISEVANRFNKTILTHPCLAFFKTTYGSYYLELLTIEAKIFDSKIMDLLTEESRLQNEYDKIIAGAKIPFDDKINNLSQMAKYGQNLDRNIRRNAAMAVDNFMRENDKAISQIYDKLVKVRDQMAKLLGFKNYLELGYLRLKRTDYDANMVAIYREQIKEHVVPLAAKFYAMQAKDLGIIDPKMYDFSLSYLDGNPTPKGNKDELVKKALIMYSEMSNETKEFFNFMIDNDLMDLETKPGKMSGGYCTEFALYKAPFIFANFNGTSDDVNTLTHEAGHAFEDYYANKFIDNPDLICPTMEAAEIDSMSMEFFSYPWLELFFGNDTKKYKHSHMRDAITFLPYAITVDHFQHLVYEKPEATPEERKQMWLNLEKIYLPWRNYGECSFTKTGTFWYRQGHIFTSPLYYIDYALAQVCAFQFYLADLKNHQDAWQRYLKLCSLGGTKPFLSLLKECNLKSPFEPDTIKEITTALIPIINQIEL